jgi:hypothetical protein
MYNDKIDRLEALYRRIQAGNYSLPMYYYLTRELDEVRQDLQLNSLNTTLIIKVNNHKAARF